MKKIALLVVMFISLNTAFAQATIDKGYKDVNFGVGFSGYGLPVYFGMDFGVYKDITVGFNAAVRFDDYYNNSLGISGNGNYHFNSLLELPSQWDLYAGLSLGYIIWFGDDGYDGGDDFGLDLQVGGRYFWNDSWAINVEFGGGTAFSGGKIGVTKKL
jgi:outer membrane immunogenic protein